MKRQLMSCLSALLLAMPCVQAQEKPKAFITSDIVSHYLWRGQDLANVCIQPAVGLRWKNLTFTVEGVVGVTREDYEELDLNLSYTYKGFSIGVNDYWSEDTADRRYFYYGKNTGHEFEGFVGYSCDYGSLFAYTMFAGNDYKVNGKRAYSSFLELTVPFKFSDLDWELKAGMTPFESAGKLDEDVVDGQTVERKTYYYADRLACNLLSLRATKTFELKNHQLPVYVELHTNPYDRAARIFLGVTLF